MRLRPMLAAVSIVGLLAVPASASAAVDLKVSSVGNPPSSKLPQQSFSVRATVANSGSSRAAASTTSFALSSNRTRGSDRLLQNVRTLGIDGKGRRTVTTTGRVQASTPAGLYYLLVCADDRRVVRESIESNNCMASATQVRIVRPVITITAPAAGATVGENVDIEFTTNVPFTTNCAIDGGAPAPCVSGDSFLFGDGAHSVAISGVDAAGNPALAIRNFNVDKTNPTVTFTSGPAADSTTASATAEVGFTADEPVMFQCSVDGAALAPCSSPASLAGLGEGTHVLQVRGIDPFGNQHTVSLTWHVDLTRPITTITSTPPTPTSDPTADFTFASNEPGSTFQCRFDGDAFVACSSPYSSGALPDGTHTFSMRATDVAGNTDATPENYTFVVDATAPVVSISSPTGEATFVTADATIALGGVAFDAGSQTSVAWSNAANGAFGPATGNPNWSEAAIPLAEGSNLITVTATDAVGNTSTATIDVTRDNAGPNVSIVVPSASGTYYTAQGSVLLTGLASDPTGVAFVTWSNPTIGSAGPADGYENWSVSLIPLVPGANTIIITATDGVDNTNTDTITVTRDSEAPSVAISAPTSAPTFDTTDASIQLAGIAADNLGLESVRWSNATNGSSGFAANPSMWSTTMIQLVPGANEITVTATDVVGQTQTDTIMITRN